MENKQKSLLFEQMPIPKAVFTLAVPTILSSLVMVLYNLADTWFVGMLNDPIQNAAVTLASPVLLAFNAVNNLFGVGTSSMMGRALGRKEEETVRRSSAFGFWASAFSGLLFSLLFTAFRTPLLSVLGASAENSAATAGYLFWTVTFGAAPSILNVVLAYLVRTEGASMHASIGTMSGCLLNIVLDPIFILPWGLNMGAAGAGLATFISNCFACLYFFVLLFIKRKSTYVCLHPKMAAPKRAIVFGICAVGIPASIQNLLNVTGMTVMNNFASAFGSDAVAAIGIAYKINMIPMQVAMGFSQGIMPLISYNYGSRNISRAKKAFTFAAKLTLSGLVLISVLFYVFAGNLMNLFIQTETIIAYGTKFLRGMCLGIPFLAMDFLCVGALQACGKGLISFVFALMRKVILEIPALIILNMLFPLYGLAYAQFVAEFILAFIAITTLMHLFRKIQREEHLQKVS